MSDLFTYDQLLKIFDDVPLDLVDSDYMNTVYSYRCGCRATREADSACALVRPCLQHQSTIATNGTDLMSRERSFR